jgi:hypothetical protein
MLLLLAGGVAGGACRQRPSQEECVRSFENFLRLNTGQILSEEDISRMARGPMNRSMASQVCVEKKSRERVLCEIEAASLEELRGCDQL